MHLANEKQKKQSQIALECCDLIKRFALQSDPTYALGQRKAQNVSLIASVDAMISARKPKMKKKNAAKCSEQRDFANKIGAITQMWRVKRF